MTSSTGHVTRTFDVSRDMNKMARRKARSPARKPKSAPSKPAKRSQDKMNVDTFYGTDKESTGKKPDTDRKRESAARADSPEDTSKTRGTRPAQMDQPGPSSSGTSHAKVKGKLPTKSKEVQETFSSKKSKRYVHEKKKQSNIHRKQFMVFVREALRNVHDER